MRMHEGQWDVSEETVARLVAHQFPQWRDLRVTRVVSHGTVNALFRLGERIVARFGLLPSDDPAWRGDALAARAAVAQLAHRVALQVPVPLAIGEPDEGYPGFWAVHEWIPGDVADLSLIDDHDEFATALADFVTALRQMPTGERTWSGRTRGGPLGAHDEQVRRCLAQSEGLVDVEQVSAAWDECLAAPRRDLVDTWIHSDLMPGNLLVRDGRLVAVIDCEDLCVGDPAVDLLPAWNLLPTGARATFRRALDVGDDEWARGRGWALCQAVVALPYYAVTNPVMVDTSRRTLAALLD